MTFFDWWGFLGTGIQSIFAWIAFNRDGFADNVSWRQAQKYQQKNYNISWIAIARDDIRDMMGISIHRINNYMIVATLILSVAAGALLSVSFSPECPGFIVFAFYLCTGISLMFLMESIMFGVKGQNSAFTNTMKLLTYQVRPENPAEYSHDYMKQSQWVERNGLSALFRIPGILPSYDTDSGQDKTKGLKDYVDDIVEESRSSFHYGGNAKGRPKIAEKKRTHLGSKATGNFDEDDINLEEATPLESLVMRTSHTWYLSKFAEFMRLWHPYDMYAKYSMGLGILCLGHSSAYFALGYLSVQGYYLTEYAATVITFAFIFMVVLIIQSTFSAPRRFVRIAAVLGVSLGPACATIAAVVVSDVAKQILVPAAYASHFLLWVLVYYVAHQMPDSHTHFIRPGEGFWSNKHKKKEKNNQDPPSDRGHPPDLESEPQESQDSHHRWKKQEEHYHQEWRRNLPTMSKTQYLEQSPCARSSLRALTCGNGNLPCDGPSAIPEEPEPKPQGEGSFKDYQDECKSQRGDVVGWPTDEDEFSINAEKTKSHIKSTAHCTILATICLWLAMVIWSILTYWFAPYEVPAMYLELARPPQVQWPSASFRPRLLACKEPIAVMSDGYKLFEFDLASESTKPISCPGLRGRVSDVSLSCTPEGCVPVALAGNRVVHCKSGPMTVQDSLAQFTVLGDGATFQEQRLVSARSSELISYSWSDDEWQTDAFLGYARFLAELGGVDNRKLHSDEGLIALDEFPETGHLMFFRRVPNLKASVQLRDPVDLTLKSQWHLPPDLPAVQAACAYDSMSILVLLNSSADPDLPRSVQRLHFGTK